VLRLFRKFGGGQWQDTTHCQNIHAFVCQMPLIDDADLESLLKEVEAKVGFLQSANNASTNRIKEMEQEMKGLQTKSNAELGVSGFLIVALVVLTAFIIYKLR